MSDREIFRYSDGLRNRCGDPLAIYRKLNHLCGGDVNEVYRNTRKGIPEPPKDLPDDQFEAWEAENPPSVEDEPTRFQASETLLAAIREAFQMAPFNIETGEGADDADCMDAFNAYCEFGLKKKRNTVTTPTSAPPTDSASSPPAVPQWRPAPERPPVDPFPPGMQRPATAS